MPELGTHTHRMGPTFLSERYIIGTLIRQQTNKKIIQSTTAIAKHFA